MITNWDRVRTETKRNVQIEGSKIAIVLIQGASLKSKILWEQKEKNKKAKGKEQGEKGIGYLKDRGRGILFLGLLFMCKDSLLQSILFLATSRYFVFGHLF